MTEEPFDAASSLFIRRWGEMGATWGISRTMAEVHALLYLATEPICTDEVMDRLAISRGSASTNLRELEEYAKTVLSEEEYAKLPVFPPGWKGPV